MIVSVKDGKTPYIGANGNWWIGETDTGVKVVNIAFGTEDVTAGSASPYPEGTLYVVIE